MASDTLAKGAAGTGDGFSTGLASVWRTSPQDACLGAASSTVAKVELAKSNPGTFGQPNELGGQRHLAWFTTNASTKRERVCRE